MTYKQEQNLVFQKFLDFYHFRNWRSFEKVTYNCSLELFLSPKCNTRCNYCYLNNFGDQLYPPSVNKGPDVVKNTGLLLDWFRKNRLFPRNIEIFSGELTSLPYFEEVLSQILHFAKFCREHLDEFAVVLPTNSTWLLNSTLTDTLTGWYNRFKEVGVEFAFSHSVDGKILDSQTRPIRNPNLVYTDEFYEKLFEFSKIYRSGFHPMIGAKGIELWKENFDWWMDNITVKLTGSYFRSLNRIYLLEVRNPDWTLEELYHLDSLIKHIILRVYEWCGHDRNVFFNEFLKQRAFNIFSQLVSSVGRGIGCSEQQTLAVRMGDLAIVSCHRSSYTGYEGGRFKVEGDAISEIEAINPEFYMLYKTFDSMAAPRCSNCLISHLCDKYCLGANFEMNKDWFVPVPSVCRMQFVKVAAMVEGLDMIGLADYLVKFLNSTTSFKDKSKANQVFQLLKYVRSKKGVFNGLRGN